MHRRDVLAAVGSLPTLSGVGSAGRSRQARVHEHGEFDSIGQLAESSRGDYELNWLQLDVETDDPLRVAGDDTTVAVASRDHISVYDAATGNWQWGNLMRDLRSIAVNGLVYVLNGDGTLHARSAESYRPQWQLEGVIEVRPLSNSAQGVVARLDGEGGDRLVAMAHGSQVWEQPTSGLVEYATAGDRVFVVTRSDDRYDLTAYDVWNDSILGSRTVALGGQTAVVGAVGDTVLLHRPPGTVVGVPVDGDARWRYEFRGSEGTTRVAVLSVADRVVAAARRWPEDEARLQTLDVAVLDPRTGNPVSTISRRLFSHDRTPLEETWASYVSAASGRVYISGPKSVLAVDPGLGESWPIPAGGPVHGIGAAGDGVVIATEEHLAQLGPTTRQCGAGRIVEASVRLDTAFATDDELVAEISVEVGDCPTAVGVELHADGAPYAMETDLTHIARRTAGSSDVTPRDGNLYEFYPRYVTEEFPPELDRATILLRGAGGVLDRKRVTIDDYRDEPGNFDINCAAVDARSVDPGTPVSVECSVANRGYAPDFEARLLADGDVVAAKGGAVGPFRGDVPVDCPGVDVELTHAFDDDGRYDLALEIEALSDGGIGARESLGTVTVGDPDDGEALSLHPGIAIGGIAGGLLVLRRRRADED